MVKALRHDGNIGIVVIGRNESAHLSDCLASLEQYSGRIVYADSASTDGSADIARRSGAIVVDIDPSKRLTPARGRNEGLATLLEHFPDCRFVQFVDGDGIVEPGWVQKAAEFLDAHERAAAVCGDVSEAHPESTIYNWLCSNEWKGPTGRVETCGGNAMIRAAALGQVGGFLDELVAGEEAELMARLRSRDWEIWRLDAPMVVHDANLKDFADWWRRARRGGYAFANVWWLTRRRNESLYFNQLRSSLFWALGLPAAVALMSAAVGQPALLLLIPAAWAAQTARIAAASGWFRLKSWLYGGLIMLAKIPETAGALTYMFERRHSTTRA